MIPLIAGALAAGTGSWGYLHDAMAAETVDGTPGVAEAYCLEGLENAPPTDPLRGELFLCVARNRLKVGNESGALDALRQVPGASAAWGPAHTLLDLLELRRLALPGLPVSCSFDRDTCGFVRTWEMLDKGVLETRDLGDDRVLAWDTNVKDGEDDRLLVAFAQDVPVRSVAFLVRTTQFPAAVRVVLADGAGLRFLGPVLTAPTDGWVSVSLPVSAFRPVDDGGSGPPRAVRVLEIVDLTGTVNADRGPNVILFDDLELR